MSGNSLTEVLLKLKQRISDIWQRYTHWENHSFRRYLLRMQGFLCAFTWQSHQRHSWCPQFYLQRLPVGRDNVSHVWRVPLWRRLRGRCQQKRVPPAGITWNPDTNELYNRACHKGTPMKTWNTSLRQAMCLDSIPTQDSMTFWWNSTWRWDCSNPDKLSRAFSFG